MPRSSRTRQTNLSAALIKAVTLRMAAADMNAVQLARAAGLTQSTLSRILTGKTSMTVVELEFVADALRTPIEHLLKDARDVQVGQLRSSEQHEGAEL